MAEVSLKSVSDTIRSSKKILLVTHSRPSVDAMCSLASLYMVIKDVYKKDVDVAIPSELSKRFETILNKASIKKENLLSSLPQKVYTISIKKQGEKIEYSINFNEDGDNFNFVITPSNGMLDLDSVKISENDGGYDLVITVDTASLNFLGDLYKSNEGFFDNTNILSFDNHKSNSGYAKMNVTLDDVDTTSQVVMHFYQDLNINAGKTAYTLLFAGIQSFLALNTKSKVRSSVYKDMGDLLLKKVDIQDANALLYSPSTLNEIFLVGDILDSSNEGTASKFSDAKIVGCKISLNKEEVETVDIDKIAQVVLWNIKVPEYKLAYIIFQKGVGESIAYIYSYDHELSISETLKTLDGKGDKTFGKIIFNTDMNSAESKIKQEMGIQFVQKENKFLNPSFAGFDDFEDSLGDGFLPKVDNNPTPLTPPPSFSVPPAAQEAQPGEDTTSGPAIFDPRIGK